MLKRKETEADSWASWLARSLARVACHDLAYRNFDLRTLVTVDVSPRGDAGDFPDWAFELHVTAPEAPPQEGYVRLAPRELGWLVSLRHDPVHRGADIYRDYIAGGATWA